MGRKTVKAKKNKGVFEHFMGKALSAPERFGKAAGDMLISGDYGPKKKKHKTVKAKK